MVSVREGGSSKTLRPKDPWDTVTKSGLSPSSRLPKRPGAPVDINQLRAMMVGSQNGLIRDGSGTVLEGDLTTLIVELNPLRYYRLEVGHHLIC